MTDPNNSSVDQKFLDNALASFIQIGALLVMLYWCWTIVAPFVTVITWGLILSVALYPTHVALTARLGGREKLSAILLVVVGLTVIAVPAWMLTESTIGGLHHISAELEDGTANIPPPAESVKDWPLIGNRVYEVWGGAASNLESLVNQFRPQLRSAGQKALAFAGHMVGTTLQFAVAIIIAGVFFMTAKGGYVVARDFSSSLVGAKRGPEFTDLSIVTIRSVAKGVLGVALIQTILATVGLVAAGIPATGLWAGAVLVLAIVQLPPLIVLGPIAIWFYSVAEPLPATVFLVYATLVSFSDAVLKPFLLGRGVEIPMLVILIGAIGGAITYGIIGLFEGAVVLALGYKLFRAWISPGEASGELAEN